MFGQRGENMFHEAGSKAGEEHNAKSDEVIVIATNRITPGFRVILI